MPGERSSSHPVRSDRTRPPAQRNSLQRQLKALPALLDIEPIMIRVLTFATLYPNMAQPVHGVFTENRNRYLAATGEVAIDVVAPVPWFPFKARMFGRYALYARAPSEESRAGFRVLHPRFPVIPKVGMSVAPWLLYSAMKPVLSRLLAAGHRYDIIDAHYFYPDGIAAAMLGRRFRIPVVITAHGTDLNIIPRYAIPRRMIVWAASQAAGLVTVSQDLKSKLVALGVEADRIRVLGNGADLKHFRPLDREAARARLGIQGPTLVAVGALIPRKGHHLTIEAMASLPGVNLLIAGDGPERARLMKLVEKLNLSDRVRFLGQVPHFDLPKLYSAADAMVLPSSFEGWASVFLESIACGTPVITTKVGGNAEVISHPAAGLLIDERNVSSLVSALRRFFANPPDRAETRAFAERYSWDITAAGQLEMFRQILDKVTAPV